MCIIAYAPEGATIKEETIRTMFKQNPHGAGIMWKPAEGMRIEIRKGFMKVEDLLEAWRKVPQSCEKAIHCRIATSGKVGTGCCHPFPVRQKATAMRKAVDKTNVALMHNGCFDFCTPKKGMKSDYSDSMLFASKVLFPLVKHLDNSAVQLLLENCSYSRLLIFRSNGDPIMCGSWHFEDGVYYSNMSFQDIKIPKSWGCYSWGSCGSTCSSGYSKPDKYTRHAGDVSDTGDEDLDTPPPYYSPCAPQYHKEILYLDISKSEEDTEAIIDEVWEELEGLYPVGLIEAYPDTDDIRYRRTLMVEIEGYLPKDIEGVAGYYIIKP